MPSISVKPEASSSRFTFKLSHHSVWLGERVRIKRRGGEKSINHQADRIINLKERICNPREAHVRSEYFVCLRKYVFQLITIN